MRMGMVIGIRPEDIPDYKALHADVWPEVLAQLRSANISSYSIFLREPENLLFGVWDYTGTDFEADMAQIAEDPSTQRWWKICGPMQVPFDSREKGEWWVKMDEVFHLS